MYTGIPYLGADFYVINLKLSCCSDFYSLLYMVVFFGRYLGADFYALACSVAKMTYNCHAAPIFIFCSLVSSRLKL
jgi:hypothetical protein